MAPKRPLPSADPPPDSSSDDDDDEVPAAAGAAVEEEGGGRRESGESSDSEDSTDDEEDDDDDDEEQKKPPPPPPPKSSSPPPPPQQQQKSGEGSSSSGSGSGSEEEESEEESDSGSQSRRYTVKPITSKPMEKNETPTPPPAKKQRPEPSPSSLKQQQPLARRKVETDEPTPKDSKKGRKKEVVENGSVLKSGEESKKPMFQRIWGGSDELALLQGMIDFREKKGMDPTTNGNAFHHYVRKSLGQEFTDSQLANKIRVLKKKYTNNEGKGKDGEDRAFSKPHEQKVFELSKKIWGSNKNGIAGGSGEQTPMPKANGTAKKSKTSTAGKVVPAPKSKLETSPERPKENGERIPSGRSDTVSMLSCDKLLQMSEIGLDQDFLKKGWEMVDEARKEQLKERWRKVQLAQMRVLAERAALIRDQTNLVLEAHERAAGK
ncbi:GLABROUS1 enhancer-binding protein-like [Syzygium oleosum]|uniref:GLABROUS1 enhancer-binding protein-like n=1 Tax=Syzygium oleosum TaxID=219896 RepID=UPI0024B905F7|nr:GLABROUS1 enhancer-binding protein-like [Syzygium oleosum]